MDFSTSASNFTAVSFPEEGANATPIVVDVRERSPRERFEEAQRGKRRRPQQTDNSAIGSTLTEMVGNPLISTTSDSVPKSILALWSRIAQANISVRMYGDLVKVANQPPGWRGERSLALSEASLKSFLDFWTAVRGAAVEPELSLAPDGSLLAEWFKSPRQRLDVRFLENKVLFGLFANNSILEGAEHLSVVAQILGTHPASPLKWGAR